MNGMKDSQCYETAVNRRELIIDAFMQGGVNNVPNTLALAQLEATLALAYEQRTANLIDYVDKIDDTSAAIPVVTEIKNRLGVNEGATR
ncbi:hypothetical protein [Arthrobacter cryoconiti]|uniref:Uncharacterized protein n=1 Tax=Arthrobacter cryoconiti TaxID=748907 RepID=A0ABV8QXL9_9MICC|nr:hypothetical protein [Arthrobacter cryoconiti]MCC9068841.1 hypothetical protein [Arthrobacter cryoconiti]